MKKFQIKSKHRYLLKLIIESRFRLYMASFCSLIAGASYFAISYIIRDVIDDIFIEQNTVKLLMLPIVISIMFFLRGFSSFGQEYFMSYVGLKIIKRLRMDLYNKIQDLPLSFFQKEQTGALMSRITNDVHTIKYSVSSAVTGLIKDITMIVGLTVTAFIMDWKLASFAFIILPIAFIPIVKIGKIVRKVSTGFQEAMADVNSFLQETFVGVKIIKAFCRENYEKNRFSNKVEKLFKIELKNVASKALTNPIMEVFAGIGIALVIWYGGYKVINKISTLGEFTAFLAAVLLLYEPAKRLSRLNSIVQEGLAATDRVFDILERVNDITEIPNSIVIEQRLHTITFKDVSFQYNEDMVLNNINLSIKEGEIIALVGMSGGGKTTLVNLIPRFYDATKGTISIDTIDIKTASISSLRNQIATVTQEPILFNDTIRNNIAYGKMNATDQEISDAAKAAYAYDFIQSFPEQFETNIGELGGRLSGGEKQRLCIARALIKDAPILILDEATSSLDSEAEQLVQKALGNLMKGRTTFIIAHRLSTVAHADRIIVIKNGEIIEEGKHDELTEKKGEYWKLCQIQFRNNS